MRVTILGCGTSGGVPRVGGDWGACDPTEAKNRRRRCSILVESERTSVLVDTAPDLREQLLDAEVTKLDAVIWTHEHADQVHGIDDLRGLYIRTGRALPGYAAPFTLPILTQRFGYCFAASAGTGYPPIVDLAPISGPLMVGDIDFRPFEQDHGFGARSLGFRFGDAAYSNDVVKLSEEAFTILKGVKLWIVDAMRYRPHPTHSHLEQTLGWIARVKPERAILTNMHIDLDYRQLCRELPPGVEPAYDGMVLDV